MALIRIPEENRSIQNENDIRVYLAAKGIDYEHWEPTPAVPSSSTAEEILTAYAVKISELKAKGSYVTADVIDVKPETPNLDAMLLKFSSEHWHDEDEVRLILDGRGLFHIHPSDGPVFAIEVEAGDLIRVPKGTHHWFDLCGDRRIRAVRLFEDPSGWTPHYTKSGVDAAFQPLCFGPAVSHNPRR
ncbi:MAG TPA: cupin domain-containing protein [Vicinamibacterales bacterium]|jgi:1,2-dihydroxy-3-keto-5-methylthiopentene dioxygenase|nr:cupin domain-containing protein [Vicinamibacterales bacterium]